ncbi:copper amine oxidase N-terminal domain-containing protein [Lysinibacillus sp. NPDC048646]|uniref:copper amine oxidase N-terminal domain-containing protein n=1 Tax=Lysinibacillus sp. NPDC048646 TaxID=3390574 RepID=UPI003D02C42D
MKNKKKSLVTALLVVGLLTHGVIVQADDDHDHDHSYKKQEKYKDYDDDDDKSYQYEMDDDDDDEDYESYYLNDEIYAEGIWNIWTRTVVADKGILPFVESKMVNLKVEGTNKKLAFLAVPKDGQIFVPGKAVAQLLGAKATYYKTSKILAIQSQGNELIFRAGTNVVYDNNVKTPLPALAFYLNEDLYLPFSVITNGLGYIVEWQENSQMFLCQPLSK